MKTYTEVIEFCKSNLMFLAMLAFVLIATTAFTLIKTDIPEKIVRSQQVSKVYTSMPVLSDTSTYPTLSAQAALVVDLDSGVTMYEKNPDSQFLPASTTKIITALVAMDHFDTDEVLVVQDPTVDGRKMGLVRGEEITAGDLIYSLLVFSANDAAEVLAQNYPGGRGVFIAAMNTKATELGLANSKFTNPAGLDSVGHVSTARDLARVAEVAMRIPAFAFIVRQESGEVSSIDGRFSHHLQTTNELLGNVEGVLGVKTGWTENAHENLITYVERDSKRIMLAVLASQDRFGETKELIDWIFTNYAWEEVRMPALETYSSE